MVNKANSRVFILVRHIESNGYNSYHIIRKTNITNLEKEKNEEILSTVDDRRVEWTRDQYPKKSSYIWSLHMDDNKHGEFVIMSKVHNKYLKSTSMWQHQLVFPNQADNMSRWKIL